MAWTTSIYDLFINWPSSVTLTLNLPEQMFQMAQLLVKENSCAKLFWKSCINQHPKSLTMTLNVDIRLSHSYLETRKCGVWSGSTGFANMTFIINNSDKTDPPPLKWQMNSSNIKYWKSVSVYNGSNITMTAWYTLKVLKIRTTNIQ